MYESTYASSDTQLVSSGTSAAGPPVAYFAEPSSTSGYMTSRPAEHASQRFPASILRPPQEYNPSTDAIPPGWGPQARSPSFPSPPLASPLIGSPFPRRDSAYSTGVQRTSSPSASSNSSRGEDGRPPYVLTRVQDQGSTANSTATPTFGAGNQYSGSTNGFAAPFPPAHRGSVTNIDENNGGRYHPGSLINIVDGFSAAPHSSAQNSVQTPFPGPEHRTAFTADAVIRHFQQDVGKTNYAQAQTDLGRGTFTPAFGAWTRSHLGAGTNDQRAAPQPPRPVSTFPPAAPLHNILHPVDQTPSMRHADVPGHSGTESRTSPSVSSSVAPSAAPSNAPTSSSNIASNADSTAPKTGNEIQIAPNATPEESESNRRRRERRSRSTFSVDQRNETSQTRAIGACLRCKSQRVRVGQLCLNYG